MAEFAGYIGNQYPPTDWGKIGVNLLEQFDKENQRRKDEKEKIDNDYAESFSKIGEYEQTTDQDVNEFIYKGVDEVRNGIKTQYDLLKKGAITMADYKLYKSTAMSDWSSLNKAVKGSASSQHVKGEAIDISGGNKIENKKIFDYIVSSGLDFDQCINEYDFTWVHISLKKSGNRKQVLIIK